MAADFIPLFFFPTTVAYVDDDRHSLNAMNMMLEEIGRTTLFNSPKACLEFFKNYQPFTREYSLLNSIKQDESYGALHHTPLNMDVTKLATMADNLHRYDEISVLIIDYQMPLMNGYDLAKEINAPVQKILLTGETKERQIIEGFNQNLIERFVEKGTATTEEVLSIYIKELQIAYFRRLSLPILNALETEKKLPLQDPAFISCFKKFCDENQVVEYYLIDKQGSFLGIDQAGYHYHFVIQSEEGLQDWALGYDVEKVFSSEQIKDITDRRKIPFFGVGVEPSTIHPSQWHNYLYSANCLRGETKYYFSVIKEKFL